VCDTPPDLFAKICKATECKIQSLGDPIEHCHVVAPNTTPSESALVVAAAVNRACELIELPADITMEVGGHWTASRVITGADGMPHSVTFELIAVTVRCDRLALSHTFYVRAAGA
jgi:hypothetical protein